MHRSNFNQDSFNQDSFTQRSISLKDPCACLVALFIPWRRTRSYAGKFPPGPTYSSVLHSNFFDIYFLFGFTLISVIGKDKQIRFISTTQYDYYT